MSSMTDEQAGGGWSVWFRCGDRRTSRSRFHRGLRSSPGGGQTNPGSAVVPVAGGVAAVEAFEDMAHLVTGQSFPSISDVDEHGAGALLTGTDGGLPAGRGVTQGVGQQVAHDLAEALAVHQYGNTRGDRNDLQAHPFGREGILGRGAVV